MNSSPAFDLKTFKELICHAAYKYLIVAAIAAATGIALSVFTLDPLVTGFFMFLLIVLSIVALYNGLRLLYAQTALEVEGPEDEVIYNTSILPGFRFGKFAIINNELLLFRNSAKNISRFKGTAVQDAVSCSIFP